MVYNDIFEYNKKWVSEKLKLDPEYFEKLSIVQKPKYLFIGCSDSRADPQELMGLSLGEVFVHRNVSNIINPIDLNVASVIQYAIENLKVKHIIVCGHYGCGGIKAAMEESGLGKNSPWLQIIKDISRIHQRELNKIKDEKKRYNRLAELNVIEQATNIFEMDCIQSRINTDDCPSIHGWVYNIFSGEIIDLKVNPETGTTKEIKNSWLQKVGNIFRRVQ